MNKKQTEALLFVARETSIVTIEEVAKNILRGAGLTEEEISRITGSTVVEKKPTGKKPIKKKKNGGVRSWKVWTPHDEEALIAMWADGKTVGQIAKSMKRTTMSVNARINLLRSSGAKIEYRNLGVRDARLNGSPKPANFQLAKK